MSKVNRSEIFYWDDLGCIDVNFGEQKPILLITHFDSFCVCRRKHNHSLSLELFMDSSELLGTPDSTELSLASAAEASPICSSET